MMRTGNRPPFDIAETVNKLRKEYESLSKETTQFKAQRDDYERKFHAQLSMISSLNQAVSDLERAHKRIKLQYEEELSKAKKGEYEKHTENAPKDSNAAKPARELEQSQTVFPPTPTRDPSSEKYKDGSNPPNSGNPPGMQSYQTAPQNQMAQVPQPQQHGQMGQMNQMNQMNSMGQMNQMGQMNPMGQMNQLSQMGPMGQMNPMNQMGQMNPMGQMGQMNQMNPMGSMSQMGQIGQMNQMGQMNQVNPMSQMTLMNHMAQMNQMNGIGPMGQMPQLGGHLGQMGQMGQLGQMNPMGQMNAMNPMNAMSAMNPMGGMGSMNPINTFNQMGPVGQMNPLNAPQNTPGGQLSGSNLPLQHSMNPQSQGGHGSQNPYGKRL